MTIDLGLGKALKHGIIHPAIVFLDQTAARFRGHGRGNVYAVLPVRRFVHQRSQIGADIQAAGTDSGVLAADRLSRS